MAEELAPEQARAFVVGKLFNYTCFDGTAGMGRIFSDGSVVGTVQAPGRKMANRFTALPPGTIRVAGQFGLRPSGRVPDRSLLQIGEARATAASVARLRVLNFAYCDFSQHNPRAQLISNNAARPSAFAAIVRPSPSCGRSQE